MTPLDLTWRIEPAALLLLVLVVGIAAAVLPYAHRSLRGDRHGRGITIAIAAMLTATAFLALSAELWMIAVAWSAATVATLVALGLGGGESALRRSSGWLLAGDFALWAAVVLAATGTAGQTPAVLIVVAAILRCALPPAHPWLIDSLYAPTPVSAALHGGIVNGGGILVIMQFDLVASSPVAIVLLASAAAIAIIAGALAALVRTDVKGRLVASTIAQMGFMLMIAALGLTAAALLHLVAHGFYKSSLFLSSSDGIDRRAAERRAPRPGLTTATERRVRAVAGALVPVTALTLVALALYPGGRGLVELLLLLVIGSAFAAAGARGAALAPSWSRSLAIVVVLAIGAAAFAALTSALTGALALERPDVIAGQPVALVIALVTVLALGGVAALRRWAPASDLSLALIALGHRLGARRVRGNRTREASPTTATIRATTTSSSPPRIDPTPRGVAV